MSNKKRGLTSVSGLGRDQGLATGAAIAEGANNFMNSFVNAQRAKYMAQAHAQQMQAVAQLRQMQAQKIMADLQDKTVDVSKLNLLAKAQQGGLDVPSSIQKDVWGNIIGKMDNPQSAMVYHKLIDHISGGASSEGLGPQTGQSQMGQPMGQMPGQQQANPNQVTLSPAEYNLYTKSIQPNAMLGATGIRAKSAMEQLQEKGQQMMDQLNTRTQGQLDLAKEHNLGAAAVAKIRGQYANQAKRIAGQFNLDIADIRGGATVDAANARADGTVRAATIKAGSTAAKSGPQSPAEKSILKKIENNQKEIDAVGKPNSMGMYMPDPVNEKKRLDFLNQNQQELYKQYKNTTGKDFNPQPQAAPTPAAPAPVAPAKQMMGPVQQGAPAPKAPPVVIPFDATQANQAAPGALMTVPKGASAKLPDGGTLQKAPDGSWQPYTEAQ